MAAMRFSKEKEFSNKNRKERLKKACTEEWDLVIIGGGITGCGIALDAALRGIKTVLVEKRDFASGTSSKSTKLIHGGLRYLKQLEIGLVRETGMERAVAHRNIPHLVHPETMLLPIVEGGEFNRFTASMAISVYDFLADVDKEDRKKTMNKSALLAREPHLNEKLLKSGIAYSEYRTDDARLTIELIKAARREGAEAFNYLAVNDFLYKDGKVIGVQLLDAEDDGKYEINAKHVVSAAGPWVDKLRKKDGSTKGKSLHLTKGVHIVVHYDRFPLSDSVYFDDFNGRMIFAIPRGKVTYIGTSDTTYKKSLDRVLCTKEDVHYLIGAVNAMFPEVDLKPEDVVSSWAGLRPLIHEDGKSPSELSRKDEIFEAESGLISIAGGKLTGFRKMSQKIVDLLIKRDASLPGERCKTKQYLIHSNSFHDYKEFQKYCKDLAKAFQDKGLSDYYSWYLTSTYGKYAGDIVQLAIEENDLSIEKALIKSEIDYTIQYESVLRPDDYFNRRSGKLYFDIDAIHEHLMFIIHCFAFHFTWTDEKFREEKKRCEQLIKDVTVFHSEKVIPS